ncbi:MAG TPA: penicillin-binding protein [Desulfobacterales bacterium]|nr:penicillin-binding protein [Desulfobacterales bacterium]
MRTRDKKWIRFRMIFVGVVLLVGLSGIMVRAYQFQVLERGRLKALANSSYTAVAKLPPKRGSILDRQGHELAVSVEVASVYAHPNQIRDKKSTAKALARELGLKAWKVERLLKSPRSFVWIKRKVETSRAEKIVRLRLPGVGVEKDTKRYYPGRELAGHLLGFVGVDNHGLEGIEKRYDRLLRGAEIHLVLMKDARGRAFLEKYKGPEQRPHTLVLSIDKDIQYRTQKALREAVRKSRAKSGTCIVMDVRTGGILAMAVVPEFNPNVFTAYKPYMWRNRAVTDAFEPGSTLKAFLLAACIEQGVLSPYTRFYCEDGALEIYGHTINDTHRHKFLTVSDIISLSSNIGAVKMGLTLGYGKFYEYLKRFGFGRRSGIDLLGEINGYIRPPDKARPIEQISVYFGQGISVTALQLVRAMAAIANGGVLLNPYVVEEIRDHKGRLIKKIKPKKERRVISQQSAYTVTNILKRVITQGGTGFRAAIAGYQVAGKTGTAQKVDPAIRGYSRNKHVASFVGFAPASEPRIAISVVIDEPKGAYYGGVVAAPVFSSVGQWTLTHLQVAPDVRVANIGHPLTTSVEKPSRANYKPIKGTSQEGLLPDFRGMTMREVFRKCFSMGISVIPEGSGFAFNQRPRPGTPLKSVKMVRVKFRPHG